MEREDGGRRRDVALDAYRGGRRASCGRMDAEICERERERRSERTRCGEGRARSQWWDRYGNSIRKRERERKLVKVHEEKEEAYPVGIGGEMTARERKRARCAREKEGRTR